MRQLLPTLLVFAALLSGGCQPNAGPSAADYEKLQAAVFKKQELLLQIHLDLDTAASEISDAERMAQEGNCSGAEFHSAEAYRKLRKADEAILDLGRELQALFNLDSSKAGG
jgi:hypothetical protein